ncbi:MAG: metallophosphoesterase [Nanoarchaeota archaeon]
MALPRYALTEDILLCGPAAFLRRGRTLVIADLHLGYEQALLQKGILVPKTQFQQIRATMASLLSQLRPETVVILGDVKHDFGGINEQEWRDTLRLLDLLQQGRKVIVVEGNHDTALRPILAKRGVSLVKSHAVGAYAFLHGDRELIVRSAKVLFIGHEHPAFTVRSGVREERFKCFVWATWKRKKLLVLPSFHPLVEGSDVQGSRLGPLLRKARLRQCFVLGDRFYAFPAP